ncbi:MAG: peptide-binding protein [Desulfovibrionaceae bacterium]|jgi:peptide/nickel transport system substrate-binding protein|nr:peptide-binding protein [Desulfovibrionaceae bacterium]
MVVCLLAVLAAASGGCGPSDADREAKPSSMRAESARGGAEQGAAGEDAANAATPVVGGRLILGEIGDASNLITVLSTDSSSAEVASHIYTRLLKYDKDLNVVPEAAESFEVLDGGKRLRFKLKKGIRWTDGVKLTAADVEFTYKLMVDPKTPTAYAENYRHVTGFKVLDPYTMEITYNEVFARSLTSWMIDILPKHLLEHENILDTKYSRAPVGAGAYTLTEWTAGSRIVLDANPDFHEGRPYIDRLVYRIIPDTATMFLELKADNLDMMGLTPQQYLFQTSGKDWAERIHKYEYLAFAYTYLGYNLDRPLFKDVRVRQALAHAIDKQEIVKGVLLGQGVATSTPYKPGTWACNENIKPYSYDPAAALALLEEAGWKRQGDGGPLMKDGKPFAFTILTNQGNEQRLKSATIIQSRLAAIGIAVKIRTVEWASFIKEFVNPGNFDAVILGWNILQDPDIYNVWHSSKAVEGGLNFVRYRNPEMDELLEKGRRTLDQKERKIYYDKIQEILHRDQPYCFLYVPKALPAVQARVRGITPAPAGITHDFYHWWVPRDLQRFSLQQQ